MWGRIQSVSNKCKIKVMLRLYLTILDYCCPWRIVHTSYPKSICCNWGEFKASPKYLRSFRFVASVHYKLISQFQKRDGTRITRHRWQNNTVPLNIYYPCDNTDNSNITYGRTDTREYNHRRFRHHFRYYRLTIIN
jgi:hypothetical protein